VRHRANACPQQCSPRRRCSFEDGAGRLGLLRTASPSWSATPRWFPNTTKHVKHYSRVVHPHHTQHVQQQWRKWMTQGLVIGHPRRTRLPKQQGSGKCERPQVVPRMTRSSALSRHPLRRSMQSAHLPGPEAKLFTASTPRSAPLPKTRRGPCHLCSPSQQLADPSSQSSTAPLLAAAAPSRRQHRSG